MNFHEAVQMNTGGGQTGGMVWRDTILLGVALGVAILLLLTFVRLVYVPRRRRREAHGRHRRPVAGTPPTPETKLVGADSGSEGSRHRRRKRRRGHRPRNPTLAETGGLPPIRPEDVPPRGT